MIYVNTLSYREDTLGEDAVMHRRLCFALAVLTVVLIFGTAVTFSSGADYTHIDLKAGDTADYVTSRTDIPPTVVNRMRLAVVNVTRGVVDLNITLYFINGTRYQSWVQLGNVSRGELSQYVIAADLSAGDPIGSAPNAPTINETVQVIVMGGLRSVNHLRYTVGDIPVDYYWDKASGLIVERNYNSYGDWTNYTLVSTSVWSPFGGPTITALLLIGGVSSLAVVVAAFVLYLRRK